LFIQATQGANQSGSAPNTVSIRCPRCKQVGTFDHLRPDLVMGGPGTVYLCGERLCPNPTCKCVIFSVWDQKTTRLAETFPSERLDFDATNIPANITNALEEAITCHSSQCFIASAIMVRKCLEELCHERGATGANLKARLKNLGTNTILPQELLDGLDDLRLLGNDAAHIESQEFNSIGKDEVEIGIEFAKEVLKAVYQYSELLKKLRSLKRTP
jgi:hypothetical protein